MTDKKITAVIVDDEPLAIEGLRLRLQKIPDLEIVGEAQDGDTAINLCLTLEPSVLFVDLQLPGINGLEVVQAIQADVMPLVVFVTAHSEYAVDAFELDAIDYILKPANLGRLQQTMTRIRQRLQPNGPNQEKFKLMRALNKTSGLAISELEQWLETDAPLPNTKSDELIIKNADNERVFVAIKDINWIDAAGDYMCVHTATENYIVRITMKKLANQLDKNMFQRIHKSTIVNIKAVTSIQSARNNQSIVTLNNDVKLKVSRNYQSVIQDIIDRRGSP